MKNIILDEVMNNGIFINDQLLNELFKRKFKKDFKFHINDFLKINEENEIKKISKLYLIFCKNLS